MVLLDGASSWLPQDPARDGGWYARTLGAALGPGLDAEPLTDLVAAGVEALVATGSVVRGEGPLSTVTIARWGADVLEVYVLGDSPAVVALDDEVVLVADPRLGEVAQAEHLAFEAHLAAGHGFDELHAELVAELQRAERLHRNTSGGYWVAEGDPLAAREAVTATFPVGRVRAVALLSDGAAAGVLDYALADWAGCLDAVAASPAGWLRRVHDTETTDPDGVRWPRTKRHDDKTVALRA